jgi:hypothetical protein
MLFFLKELTAWSIKVTVWATISVSYARMHAAWMTSYPDILVDLGDFGQIPGPSLVLFGGCCGVRFCA